MAIRETKKKFIFTAKWQPSSSENYGGNLKLYGGEEHNTIYVSAQPIVCKTGAKLYKWLGVKPKKVKITVITVIK